MFLGRPVHVLPGPVDLIGDLVAEVPLGPIQGPIGHDVPEDLVGIGPSHRTRLSQDEQVQLALLVQLQDLEDLPPKLHGLEVHAEHEARPIGGEVLVQELEVVVLPIGPCRILQVLQPSKSGQRVGWRDISICRFLCLRCWRTWLCLKPSMPRILRHSM